MKKWHVILAAAGVAGWVAYAYRDRLLAGMLGLLGRLQALEGVEEEVEVAGGTIRFPKVEEDLDHV